MFPTTEKQTGRPAIDRNFLKLDDLLTELNQEKEQTIINPPPPNPNDPPSGEYFSEETEQRDQLSPEIAALTGRTIAGTIDTVLGTGCSLYAKNSQPEKYQATDKQLEQLNTAWAAVAAKYNYKIEDSPWFNVGLLSVAVYLPKLQDAKKDRRFAEIDEKLTEVTRQLKEHETRLNIIKDQTADKK